MTREHDFIFGSIDIIVERTIFLHDIKLKISGFTF